MFFCYMSWRLTIFQLRVLSLLGNYWLFFCYKCLAFSFKEIFLKKILQISAKEPILSNRFKQRLKCVTTLFPVIPKNIYSQILHANLEEQLFYGTILFWANIYWLLTEISRGYSCKKVTNIK